MPFNKIHAEYTNMKLYMNPLEWLGIHLKTFKAC